MSQPDSHSTFRFGEFELDISAYELRRGGQPVHLERQPMDLLILLVERPRQLVWRADIVKRLWDPGVFVDVEHVPSVHLLGDSTYHHAGTFIRDLGTK